MKKIGTSASDLEWRRAEAARMAKAPAAVTRRLRRAFVECEIEGSRCRVEFRSVEAAQAAAAKLRAAGHGVCRIDLQFEVATIPAGCRRPRVRYEWETLAEGGV